MKIQNVEGKRIEVTVLHQQVQEELCVDFDDGENSNVEIIEPKTLLLAEQILAVQRTKTLLGLESLAASDLSSGNKKALVELAELDSTYWSQYNWFHCSQETLEQVIVGMKNLLEGLTSDVQSQSYNPEYMNDITNKLLVRVVEGDGVVQKWGWSFDPPLASSRKIAAQALNIMIQKVGNTTALPANKEVELINILLNSPIREIRLEGAKAVRKTYKHEWRKNLEAAGLIAALKREEDDEIRAIVSCTIIFANPEAIFKTYTIPGAADFMPISRATSDGCIDVKSNLTAGIRRYLEARDRRGVFYNDFREDPHVISEEVFNSLKYSLENLENTYSMQLSNQDKSLFFRNAAMAVIESTNHEIRGIVKNSSRESDYIRLLKRLLSLDLVKFIESISSSKIDQSQFSYINIDPWKDCSPLIDTILKLKIEFQDKILVDFFALKKQLNDKKQSTSNATFQTNISRTLDKIDNAVQLYLTNTTCKSIKWGNKLEFNSVFANLLDCFEHTHKEIFKYNILNLFENLNKNGLVLDGHRKIPFHEALNDENKSKLKIALRAAIYSEPITQKFFLHSPERTITGKALVLYRAAPDIKCFKAYYGLVDLKLTALEQFAYCINGSGNSKGLLLSGTPGTGKSAFAEVLANEVAIPLKLIIPSKVFKGSNNEVLINENDNPLTLKQYFDRLSKSDQCVLLVDEIDEIILTLNNSVSVSQFLSFFQKLRDDSLPVMVIATTNSPILDSVYGIKISDEGSSKEMDLMLKEHIPSDFFDFLKPCYLFHRKSVVEDFTRGYLKDLLNVGKIAGDIDLASAARLSRGLTPLKIMNSLARIPEAPLQPKSIIDELRKLRLGSGIVKQQESTIRSTVDILQRKGTHSVMDLLDYIELALVAEDAPTNLVVETIKNTPSPLSQTVLMESLQKLQ